MQTTRRKYMKVSGRLCGFACLVLAALIVLCPLDAAAESFEDFGKRIDRELSQIRKGLDRMGEKAEEAGEKAGEGFQRRLQQAEENWQKTEDAFSHCWYLSVTSGR
jgi:hypothetical protein